MNGPAAHASGGLPASGKPCLLLAEEDLATRAFLCAALRANYEVQAVADGEAVWTAVQPHQPALLLADVFLPAPDGIDLTTQPRADARAETRLVFS